VKTVAWAEGAVELIDQTRLPHELVVLQLRQSDQVARAIATMQVRGAPAIGVAAAMGLALAAGEIAAADGAELVDRLEERAREFKALRPTAVNLAWALDRILAAARDRKHLAPADLARYLQLEAQVMATEDVEINRAMGRNAVSLFPDAGDVLTICNTGSLATVEYGTALGCIRAAVEAGKRLHVWVCETRPRLQGARLNAWELLRDEIPFTVITDGMAAHMMARGRVDMVVAGADRIAANGDTANKIGTYSLAVLAHFHKIPFYIAAPVSTFDPHLPTGAAIPIEERDIEEVTHIGGQRVMPEGVVVANPSFDVTPAQLIRRIVCERAVLQAPYDKAIAGLFAQAQAR